jgi:hypothetical protein
MRHAHLPVISPVSDLFSRSHLATHQPHIFCLCVSRQSIHKFFQSSPVSLCQRCFQGMTERTFQSTLPAFTPVVQIGSPPRQFTGWVYLHSIRSPYNTNHLPLGQNFTTAHACPLRHVLYSLNRFLRHLHLKLLQSATTFYRLFHRLLNFSQQFVRHTVTILPIFSELIAAAFVFLATDHFAAFLIQDQLNALFLAFLAFLLVRRFVIFASRSLKDLGLHGEEFIQ